MPTSASPPTPSLQGRAGFRTQVFTRPGECWHLARYATLRGVRDEIRSLAEGDLPSGALQSVSKMVSKLDEEVRATWQMFIESAQGTIYELDAFRQGGEPVRVEIDPTEHVVVVMWNEGEGEPSPDDWGSGMLEVVAPGDGTQSTFQMSTPFREIRIQSLPAGTRYVRITDMRHAATAALREVVAVVLRDIESFGQGIEPAQTWQRMRYQASFFHAAVRVSVKHLQEDEFRLWRTQLPDDVQIDEAPARIAELASSLRAQRILALHIVARRYSDALSAHEQSNEGTEKDWVKAVRDQLKESHHALDQAMDGYTTALLAFARLPRDDEHELLTILQPYPRTLPLLAVVPMEKSSVKSMRKIKKAPTKSPDRRR